MAQVTVSINGRQYRMECEDGQEPYLMKLASDLDQRIARLRTDFGEIGDMRLTVLAALTIADELGELGELGQRLRSLMAAQSDAVDPILQSSEPTSTEATSSTASRAELMPVNSEQRVTIGMTVNRAGGSGPASDNAEEIFARKLSEEPVAIAAATRLLSTVIKDQIDYLNASKPNEGEGLDRHNKFVEFLSKIAGGLNELANAIDRAIAKGADGKPEPILLGKAADIARRVGAELMEGVERHRALIVDCAIKTSLVGAGALFLTACGLGGWAGPIIAAIMGLHLAKSGR